MVIDIPRNIVHFLPWGDYLSPCGYRAVQRNLNVTDRRKETTCGRCQSLMSGWSSGERPVPVWPEDIAHANSLPDDLLVLVRKHINEPAASSWCVGHNGFLGTRPVDAWVLGYKDDVEAALLAWEDGVFV